MSKVALVVGAGPGIGSSVAKKFAREGFKVCVARRNPEQLKSLSKEIKAEGGQCIAYGCDMRKEEDVRNLVESVENTVGPISCGVHNIGANIGYKSVKDTSTRIYTKVWVMATLLSQPNNNHNPNNKTTITVVGLRLSNRWETTTTTTTHHPPPHKLKTT